MRSEISRRGALLATLAAVASPAFAAGSPEDQALIEKARDYLRGLSSAIGRFTQADPRGRLSTGTFYLRRPGRARFEYDPPSGLVVASNGFRVAILNSRLGTLDAYPLAATPLSVLLSRDIRIDRGVAIDAVRHREGGFSILARQASKKSEGQISVDFTDPPMALAGWSITDAQGGVTRVKLSDFAAARPAPNSFFELKPPGAAAKSTAP